ncbi:MAG: serine hydrolase domain-containing protein [Candidatus Krumholzibacteria bacterium]|jgi:D-alanyl-D-alanine carboxypeptidase|nr:serine hydrolase domain-containing protein [Candidatus Krumholzibacteria bacterium]
MPRSILMLWFLVATVPLAANAAAADLGADLQQILADFLAENPAAPGVAAAVVCPPLGLDWTGAAGKVAHGSDQPLAPAHTFRIASNTKTYVAAAILRLAEDGRLDLDAPLATYLPPAHAALLAADGYDIAAITLRQVMSHTAGLADHSGDDRYGEAIIADPYHRWTRDEQIRRCVELFDPLGPPDQQYVYSDTGYVLLGGVVEQVTGRTLGVAVRELLDFARLGLRATWWEYQEEAPPRAGPRAHQYIGEYDSTDWHASFDLYGGGGLIADVHDLGGFMRALLKGRVLRNEPTLAAMTGDGTTAYRLGLMVADLGGRLAWGHQGFWNTFAFHVPSLDATVAGCVLNHDAANGRELAARLVARIDRAARAD